MKRITSFTHFKPYGYHGIGVNDVNFSRNCVMHLTSVVPIFIINTNYFSKMKIKLLSKILLGIVVFVLLIILLIVVVAEPLIRNKIRTELNAYSSDYFINVDKVHVSLFKSGLELETLTISSKLKQDGHPNLKGEIAFLKIKGINLLKVIFKKEIYISEVNISNINIEGKLSFHEKSKTPKLSPLNIHIDSLFLDKINLKIKNTSSAQAYTVQDGILKLYDIEAVKKDTLSLGLIKQFDFYAMKFVSVSPDSMYTNVAIGINYSSVSKKLAIDSVFIQPDYKEFEFTARSKFATDRIEARIGNIHYYNFSAADYIKHGNLISSFIEIGDMEMNVFRDTRKETEHKKTQSLQELIYNFPGTIHIDSIGLNQGTVTYTEQVARANEPGVISFNEIKAKIYKIANDVVYKTEEAFIMLRAEALLMGKGKVNVLLKARLFDKQNTFSLDGSLSGMDAAELNPMLEKNAFIYVTSGRIDAMNFNLVANNTKATGKMTLLYHGLNVAVKNKRTDNTTGIKERFESLIVNKMLLDSNPLPDKPVRVGTIDYKRDPERFLFNYSAKSILTGIKSSLIKRTKK